MNPNIWPPLYIYIYIYIYLYKYEYGKFINIIMNDGIN